MHKCIHSGQGSIGTSAGKEGELLGEELERAGREQEKEEEEENLLQVCVFVCINSCTRIFICNLQD